MRGLSSGSMIYRLFVLAVLCQSVQVLYAQSSPHGPLKQVCSDCHTTTSWKELASPMKFSHVTTGFTLQGAHANIQCLQCHTTKRFAGTSSDCFSCHKKDFSKAMSPNHQVGQLSHDCISCHTLNSWRPSEFDHAKTNFQLAGAHASVECASCHVNNRFKGLPADCFYCHQKDFTSAKTPDHSKAQFSHDCVSCHTMSGWQPSTFDHKKTNFALVGVHQTLECASCHKNGRFKGIAQDCYSCHQKDYSASVQPNHAAAQFDRNCLTCHSVNGWTPSSFDHAKTDFKLTGAHTATECSKCHTGGVFKGTSKECYPCHQKDAEKVVSPNHIKGQFSRDCLTCHTSMVWKPSVFDHNKTVYPLAGAHRTTECAKCHTSEKYKGLPSDCFSCHSGDYTKTEVPSHQTGQFSHDCLSCHSNLAWKPSTFDHVKTSFPLKGAHVSVDCASCHTNGQFKGLPSDCFTCHRADYTAATNPNHTTGQFSHDCLSCHTITAWKPATFNHNATLFPLTGAHASAQCASCHKNGQFTGLSTNCYSCHQSEFNATSSPNHVTSQFSHDCLTCHTNTAWKPSTFNHATTSFPLTGAHSAVTCASCHKNGQFAGLPSDCYSCHQNNFNATASPNHVTSQFSHDCLTCHTNTAWKPSTFNHSSTAFPLLGAHAAVSCMDCHKNGQYKGTPVLCYSCHQADFNAVTDPNHVANNFDHNCLSCHTMNAWNPATFNHSTTIFPLTGAHIAATCASCHVGGKYKGTTTDCYTCHTSDYTGTTNPAHASANYPKACLSCHTTTAWKPSSFNHTPYFPIGTGTNHRPGRWTTCADCHTSSANFKIFSCLTCHEHNKTSMDSKHAGRSGYLYDSNACYKCHPTGRE